MTAEAAYDTAISHTRLNLVRGYSFTCALAPPMQVWCMGV